MAQTDNHINYTAEDLLRYARGQMTPEQMHAIEKSALEDSFLAEALEGYTQQNLKSQPTNSQEAILEKLESFKNKIGVKEDYKDAKLIPLWRQKWLQYAVAASVLLAGGWWVLSLTQSPAKENEIIIAQNETVVKAADSVTTDLRYTLPADNQSKIAEKATEINSTNPVVIVKKEKPVASPGLAKKDESKNTDAETLLPKDYKNEVDKISTGEVATNTKAAPIPASKDQTINQNANTRPQVTSRNMAGNNAGNFANTRRYTFNGKIVDAHNNPLPYSNVMIPGEGVGTYSDAKGNFNFVYVDSTLPVRARSLGYEEKTYTMQPDVKENRIVLREDEELKRRMVVTRQEKQVSNKSYKPIIVEKDSLFGAEPGVGWHDYNIYALNNSRAIEMPNKRLVQLSFDVSKNGEVENITVEKSGGKELDEEAIRLLKEGPKWKAKKGARSRATVKLNL